jgi:putative hemolysin
LLAKLVGGTDRNPFTMREEIITMLKMPASTDGDIQPVEKQMIQRLFNFTETRVEDSMRPLIAVTAIDREATCGEARRLAIETSHARLPVFEERIDQIVGMLYVLDLLGEPEDRPITEFIREALYVPATKSVQNLLVQLRQTGEVVAVVVDEFGAAEGIITVEDIVEEVVEDLSDEYDGKEPSSSLFQKLDERDYLTSGRTELSQIAETLGIKLPSEDYSTIAGYILNRTGNIPAPGTQIEADKVILNVHRASARAIEEVRIRWS